MLSISGNEDLGEFTLTENISDLAEISIKVRNSAVRTEVDRIVSNLANTSPTSGTPICET